MSPAICRWGSKKWQGTFKDWALTLQQACSQREKWVRRTSARASSSWPTARAADAGSSGARVSRGTADTLTAVSAQWPTPTGDSATHREGRYAQGGMPLSALALWPTVTAGDAAGGGSRNLPGSKAHAGISLTDLVLHGGSTTPRNPNDPRTKDRLEVLGHTCGPQALETPSDGSTSTPPSRLRLNPRFVEWLMGVPDGWTDFAFWATESCLPRPSTRSASSRENCTTLEGVTHEEAAPQ